MPDAYPKTWAESIASPARFWARAADEIEWMRRPRAVFDASRPPTPVWFPGGMLNACANALDLHVRLGRGEQPALLAASATAGHVDRLCYRELLDEVARFAGALVAQGVEPGDRVLLYLPAIPEAVVGMLAAARLGAIHVVVSGGLRAGELAQRIQQTAPKLVLTASCGVEPGRVVAYHARLERALEGVSRKPRRVIVLQREPEPAPLVPGRDLDWRELAAAASPAGAVPVEAKFPLHLLYGSGTTGPARALVRDHGGYAVAQKWGLRHVLGMQEGEVLFADADLGSVEGHAYGVWAPLLLGCTSVLCEGRLSARASWRLVADLRVNRLLTSPASLREIRCENQPQELRALDLAGLRALFVAGERADADTLAWAERALGVPAVDLWGQAETGGPIAARCLGLASASVGAGAPARAVPGYDPCVLADDGRELPRGETGHLAIRLPLPPGCLRSLYENEGGLESTYLARFPGCFATGDTGAIDADGGVRVHGRSDEWLELAGGRFASGPIEAAITADPDVAECAVVGARDERGAGLALALFTRRVGTARDADELARVLAARAREVLGPEAVVAVCALERLPKTVSGRILRGTLRRIANGEPWRTPPTLEDPAVLEAARRALAAHGYPPRGGVRRGAA